MDKVKTAWKVGYKHQKVSCIQIWNYHVKSAYFLLVTGLHANLHCDVS